MRTFQNNLSGWLAFELSVLKRLKFRSVSIPFNTRPNLGSYLKRSGIKVLANDPLRSAYEECVAHIANNSATLSADETAVVLEDAYVPRYALRNEGLKEWFNETDAWWFDNVRANIERLSSETSRALAISTGLKVGDYALSFDDETRRLRQPLSNVFKRILGLEDPPVENGEENVCQCSNPVNFTAESQTELFFLKLPAAQKGSLKESLGRNAWREVWVREEDDFWRDLEGGFEGKLGSHVETKSQYLEQIKDILGAAGHIKHWAIEHVEDGFVQTHDIVEVVSDLRPVDTVYTKDFSELTGLKAVMITA